MQQVLYLVHRSREKVLWRRNTHQARTSSRFNYKRWVTENEERAILSRAARRVSRRKECRTLSVEGGTLGSELRVTWCVTDKEGGKA